MPLVLLIFIVDLLVDPDKCHEFPSFYFTFFYLRQKIDLFEFYIFIWMQLYFTHNKSVGIEMRADR